MSQKEQEQKDYTNQIYQLASGTEGVPEIPFTLNPEDGFPMITDLDNYEKLAGWCNEHGVDSVDVGRVAVAAFTMQMHSRFQSVQNNPSFSQSQY